MLAQYCGVILIGVVVGALFAAMLYLYLRLTA